MYPTETRVSFYRVSFSVQFLRSKRLSIEELDTVEHSVVKFVVLFFLTKISKKVVQLVINYFSV